MVGGKIVLLFFLFNNVEWSVCDCILSLKNDFGSPSPVYIQNGGYLASNAQNGDVILKRSDTLLVACPGDRRYVVIANQTTNDNVVEAHCIINCTFRVGRWIGQFKDIHCNTAPIFSADETNEKCHFSNKMYRIGYEIKNKFYKLYEACFDKNLLTTSYVIHDLSPNNNFPQLGGSRPQFTEGKLFGKVRMSKLYKAQNQKDRVDGLLGKGKGEEYVTKKQYITRGHLAARADFQFKAEQKASFHYVNSAPQWFRGNAGDWAALEEALRRRVSSLNTNVAVYTGTHEVMSLVDSKGALKELYLHTDANNNDIVPVPLYFYKLVHNPREKTATAFISINSSYYNTTMLEHLTFCNDVCEGNNKFNWLRWRANDGTHSFCCNYEEFVTKVDYLPKLNVVGLFY